MPAALVTVKGHHIDMVEPIIGQRDVETPRHLVMMWLLQIIACAIRFLRFRKGSIDIWTGAKLWRPVGHRLNMILANEGRRIACIAQQFDKGGFADRQMQTVMPQPVDRWITAGQDRGAVGHADRCRNIEIGKIDTARGKRINMGCLYNRMTIASQPVGAVLVGHYHQDVWLVGHVWLTFRLSPALQQGRTRHQYGRYLAQHDF